MDRQACLQTTNMVRVLSLGRDQQRSLQWRSLWLAAAMSFACSGKNLEVGSDLAMPGGGGTGGGAGGPGAGAASNGSPGGNPGTLPERLSRSSLPGYRNPGWNDDVPCEPAPLSPLVGKWSGHWPGPGPMGDALLEIAGLTPAGLPCGHVTIGMGPPVPPATDPSGPYPPDPASGGYELVNDVFIHPPPWPGFAYRMYAVEISDNRLAFRIGMLELYRGWCDLQSPFVGSSGMFSLLPEISISGGRRDAGGCMIQSVTPGLYYEEMDCFAFSLRMFAGCACTSAGCDGNPDQNYFELDLHRDDDAWEGTTEGKQPIFLDPVVP